MEVPFSKHVFPTCSKITPHCVHFRQVVCQNLSAAERRYFSLISFLHPAQLLTALFSFEALIITSWDGQKNLPSVIYSRSYCSGLFFQTTQTVNLKNNQNDLSRIKQQIIQNKQHYFLFRRDMMQCPFAFYCNSNSFVLNSRLTYLGYFGTRKSLNESFEWKSRTEAKNHKVCFYLKHEALPQSKLNERPKVACEKKDPTVHVSSIIVTYNILRFLLDELAVKL